jgi:hypothetical protein
MQCIYPKGISCGTPVVKIFAFLEIKPRLNKKTDLTGRAIMNIFQRLPCHILLLYVFRDSVSPTAKLLK